MFWLTDLLLDRLCVQCPFSLFFLIHISIIYFYFTDYSGQIRNENSFFVSLVLNVHSHSSTCIYIMLIYVHKYRAYNVHWIILFFTKPWHFIFFCRHLYFLEIAHLHGGLKRSTKASLCHVEYSWVVQNIQQKSCLSMFH